MLHIATHVIKLFEEITMKIHLLSDLHLEFSTPSDRFGAVDSDVVVLAGDIHTGAKGIAWAATVWMDRPVIYVPGNHEFYRRTYVEHRETMRKVAADYDNLHLLDRGAVVIEDVLFIGATLWTNFEYWGKGDMAKRAEAMSVAAQYMNDYRLIRVKDYEDNGGRSFMPEDSKKIFDIELAYLQGLLELDFETLAKRFNVDRITKRVVVTHHLPAQGSVHPQYANSELNPAFASRLDDTVALADLWLHGHTHESCDYVVNGENDRIARVVCNPRGYSRYERDVENSSFDPTLVLEI